MTHFILVFNGDAYEIYLKGQEITAVIRYPHCRNVRGEAIDLLEIDTELLNAIQQRYVELTSD
jgi:hypothetical protein